MAAKWLEEVFEAARKSLAESKDWRKLAGIKYKPFIHNKEIGS